MPMNPTRKRRLTIVLSILAAAAIAAVLVVLALQNNMNYLLTPSQVQSGLAHLGDFFLQAQHHGQFRAGRVQRQRQRVGPRRTDHRPDARRIQVETKQVHRGTPVRLPAIAPCGG